MIHSLGWSRTYGVEVSGRPATAAFSASIDAGSSASTVSGVAVIVSGTSSWADSTDDELSTAPLVASSSATVPSGCNAGLPPSGSTTATPSGANSVLTGSRTM